MSLISNALGPILVRGTGDIASAIALRLFEAGYPVLMHDEPEPTALRRGMAFTDAVFDGTAVLDGTQARRIDLSPTLDTALTRQDAVLVTIAPWQDTLAALPWAALVDARLRKRAIPERQCGLAPITIGVGPNFVAGEHVDYAIETSWGEHLGTIVTAGPTLPLAGEPRTLGGVGRERFIYAPAPGRFYTKLRIGVAVIQGDEVANVDDLILYSPLSGIIRGLTHDNVFIADKTKVVEIDPRGDPSTAFGIGERPKRIAQGVHHVLHSLPSTKMGTLCVSREDIAMQ